MDETDEIQTHNGVGFCHKGSKAKLASINHNAAGSDSRITNEQARVASQNAPMCSLSDVWEKNEDVRPVRVLHTHKGGVQGAAVPKPDRRSFFKNMEKVANA